MSTTGSLFLHHHSQADETRIEVFLSVNKQRSAFTLIRLTLDYGAQAVALQGHVCMLLHPEPNLTP